MSHLSLVRPHRRGPFREDQALLRVLTPHLQRAIQLHTRLVELRSRRVAIDEALDRIPVGILLLDGSGKTLVVNRAASEMIASKDGLTLGREGLAASNTTESRELRPLIAEAAATGTGSGAGSGGALAVSRPSLRRPLSVLVTPVTARVSTFGEVSPAVVVFVTDPEREIRTDGGVLHELYRFTPAKVRVATRLMQGESVEEAARNLDIMINTARTHVRHLFEKTDTNRHRELVRLLLLGCTQIRGM